MRHTAGLRTFAEFIEILKLFISAVFYRVLILPARVDLMVFKIDRPIHHSQIPINDSRLGPESKLHGEISLQLRLFFWTGSSRLNNYDRLPVVINIPRFDVFLPSLLAVRF